MDDYVIRHYWSPQPPADPRPRTVVSIPVLDGNRTTEAPSDATRLAAAVRIQKFSRGFLVRKCMKTVRNVERQVEEIAARIEGSLDLIANDEKERLKVNEMVMALLFKLDSVRGVRDYRKRVIRRAIALQEALDAVVDAGSACGIEGPGDGDVVEEEAEKEVAAENERLRQVVAELLERSAEQSGAMLSLARRVEMLERKVERLGRKKRRKQHFTASCRAGPISSRG